MPLVVPSVNMCSGDVICFCSKQIRKEFSDNIIFINDVGLLLELAVVSSLQ